MKRKSIVYVLVAAMMFSLFAAAPGADAAKKPALNKKSASIKVGDKLKLKVKNNKKKVKWSTSKKKVATVTKKGVVTGKSAGKAKITAKIGKTKLVCKVTVTKKEDKSSADNKQPVQTGTKIESVTFDNVFQIRVKLSAAQALTAANFTVKSKIYEVGKYIRNHKIQSITSTDKINYLIELADQGALDGKTFVQITVTGLTGTGTDVKEEFFNRGVFNHDQYNTFKVEKGEYFREYVYYDYSSGNSVVESVSGVPNGVFYDSSNPNFIYFYGKPTQPGQYTATIKVSDEFGSVTNVFVNFMVYDDNTIIAEYRPVYAMVSSDGTRSLMDMGGGLYVCGGSGNYVFTTEGEDYGITLDSSGELDSCNIIIPGNYTVNVKITDLLDSSLFTLCKLNIIVKKGATVKGTIKDLSGNILPGASVYFDNRDYSVKYVGDEYANADDTGGYSGLVPYGEYNAYAYLNGVKGTVRSFTANADLTGIDFTVPVYKVTLQYAGESISGPSEWYDTVTGKSYEAFGNSICLPEGTYNLEYIDGEGGWIRKSATITNLVVNASAPKTVTVPVTVSSVIDELLKGTISVETKTVAIDGSTEQYDYYKFVPTETKTYYFSSTGDEDTEGELRSETGEQLNYDDDSGSDSNFFFDYECEKGKTYYFGVKPLGSSVSATIKISIADHYTL